MNVIVTGGAGFVGSHLCAALLRRGNRVTAIDSLVTGTQAAADRIADDPNGIFIRADVSHGLPDSGPVDVIFHLASPASPFDYAREPIATLRVNAYGTEAVAAYAARCGARVLYASTSEVYGDPLEHPQRETYWGNVNPNGERSCYDEAKRFGEAMLFAYHRTRGLDLRVARIFNTYGPNMRFNDGRVVPSFISSALHGEPLTVFGDGHQTRSLCYVDDLVAGLIALAELPSPAQRVVNLGNDSEVTVLEIARIVCELTGAPLDVRYTPLPPDDPTRRRPDLTVARRLLGFEARTPLRDGLARTIDAARPLLTTSPV